MDNKELEEYYKSWSKKNGNSKEPSYYVLNKDDVDLKILGKMEDFIKNASMGPIWTEDEIDHRFDEKKEE